MVIDGQISRRDYLVWRVVLGSPETPILLAYEAVSSTAIEHPEWDMEETHTWEEWESQSP